MQILLGVVFLICILAAAFAITAIGISLITRDKQHGTSGALGSAMLELQTLIDPAKRQVLEARRELEEAEEGETSGDPPAR